MFFRNKLISLVFALVPFAASAQSGEALPFIRIVQDPGRAGLAGAGSVSAASAAWASFENPTAALNGESKGIAGLGVNIWAPSDAGYYSAGASLKLLENLSVSAGAVFGVGETYDVYSSAGLKSGAFTPTEYMVNVGAAYGLLPFLSLGVNIHYAGQSLAEGYSYGAVFTDILAGVEFGNLKLAAGIASLGSKVKSAGGNAYPLPASLKLALGYEGCSLGILSYGAYADADYYLYGRSAGLSAGVKLGYSDLVGIKAGYHFATANCIIPAYASVGIYGSLMGISLNLACLFGGNISGTVSVGLGYSF